MRFRAGPLLIVCAIAALFIRAEEEPPALAAMQLARPEPAGKLADPIKESSGLVRSRRHSDVQLYWTLGDSGNAASLYAFNDAGKLLKEIPIPNAKNVDWEDLAIDKHGRLVIADIGDNARKRETITLYRLPEPDVFKDERAANVEVFHFKYPKAEGAQDAEALIVIDDAACLFTKHIELTRVYRLPLPEKAPEAGTVVEAELIDSSKLITGLTGASLSSDGRVALVTYISVMVLDQPDAKKPWSFFERPRRSRLAWLGQTEAVAWDGDDLFLTTEGGEMFRVKNARVPPKE
jgi:hypothetical protein